MHEDRKGWRKIFAFSEDPDFRRDLNDYVRGLGMESVFTPYSRTSDAGHWTTIVNGKEYCSGRRGFQPYEFRAEPDVNCSLFSMYVIYERLVDAPKMIREDYLYNYWLIYDMLMDMPHHRFWWRIVNKTWAPYFGLNRKETVDMWLRYAEKWKSFWCK